MAKNKNKKNKNKNRKKNFSRNGFNFFDKIFIINLEESTYRKNHMQEQMKKLNIQNYEFLKAINKNNITVKEYLNDTDKVQQFPPCFRCSKNMCVCSDNTLIDTQIANWLSYKKLFQTILDRKLNWILSCEDDLLFYENASNIVQNIFDKNNTLLGLDSPILIRCEESRIKKRIPDEGVIAQLKKLEEPQNIKQMINIMSNACFAFNYKFAEQFIKNFKKIETTSDLFIHSFLIKKCQVVDYTLHPSLAIQLSFSNNKNFKSQIRPRELNSDQGERESVVFRKSFEDFVQSKINDSIIEYIKIQDKEMKYIKEKKLDKNFDEFFFKISNNYFNNDLLNIIQKSNDFDIFIDVGAHMGRFALPFNTFFSDKEYIGIEPDYFSFQVLKHNMEINNFKNYKLYNVSVGSLTKEQDQNDQQDQDILIYKNNHNSLMSSSFNLFVGKYKLYVSDIQKLKSIRKIIQTNSIFESQKIFLKINTNGMETFVLRNIEPIISNIKYILIFLPEIYDDDTRKSIFNFLNRHNKNIYALNYDRVELESPGIYYLCC